MKSCLGTIAVTFTALLALPVLNVYAIGISVRPSELHVQANTGRESGARIRVKNPSGEVALFEVYPEEFEGMITASPAKFTLESGEEKDVLIKFKFNQEGIFHTHLAVVARPLDNPEGVGGGAKIALQIESRPRKMNLALISEVLSNIKSVTLAVFLAGIATLALVFKRRLTGK
ncbi:MAG TPA: hypothetical protein VJL32_02370 [Candidatus Paceibacterota bacterium]